MSNSRKRTVLPATGALSVAAIAMVLAGCGSSSPSYGGSSNPTTASTSSGGDQETIGTTSGSMGTYLTADSGRAVYLWEADHMNASNCNTGCSSVWPPVTTDGTPKASGSAVAADLGTIHRSDGKTQVTYKGHPLYYYAPDSSSGQTTGQGSNSFGAKWWLVAPTGAAVTGSGASSGSSSSGGGGGGW